MAGCNWTRQDYRAIATVLNDTKPDPVAYGNTEVFAQWQRTVHAFAKACSDNAKYTINGNKNYDAERFYEWATR